MIGVYKITSPTNRIYVGSSLNVGKRKNKYKNLHCKEQPKIYHSLLKYGWNNHIFEILEECELKDLYPLERAWGLFYNVLDQSKGLNCNLPGYGEFKVLVSLETKKKMSISGMGKIISDKQKDIISKTHKNKIVSKETIDKIIASKSNISDETREKMSLAQTKRMSSPEERKKLSKINSKKVIDVSTKIIYDSIKEAAIKNNMKKGNLAYILNGKYKNKTNLMYLKKYEQNKKDSNT